MLTMFTAIASYPTNTQDAIMPRAHVMTGNSGIAYDCA